MLFARARGKTCGRAGSTTCPQAAKSADPGRIRKNMSRYPSKPQRHRHILTVYKRAGHRPHTGRPATWNAENHRSTTARPWSHRRMDHTWKLVEMNSLDKPPSMPACGCGDYTTLYRESTKRHGKSCATTKQAYSIFTFSCSNPIGTKTC